LAVGRLGACPLLLPGPGSQRLRVKGRPVGPVA
jgi:hypothetical protein